MYKKEIIRRCENKESISEISKNLGYDRKTVRKYIKQIQDIVNQEDPITEVEVEDKMILVIKDYKPKANRKRDIFEAYYDEIKELIVEKGLKVKSAYKVTIERHSLEGKVSINTFRRFVKERDIIGGSNQITCRMEVDPGKQIQVDYAKVGTLYDPISQSSRSVYVFIGILSHSRHKYAEFVYKQDTKSFISSHIRMFEYFGGVPEHILIDNLNPTCRFHPEKAVTFRIKRSRNL